MQFIDVTSTRGTFSVLRRKKMNSLGGTNRHQNRKPPFCRILALAFMSTPSKTPRSPRSTSSGHSHGLIVQDLAKRATSRASKKAFAKVKSQLIERDGWLVRIDKAGKIIQRVARIKKNRSLDKQMLL
jgi:hypothetical protein